MRLRRRDGVPFDGIQTQIDKLKKPMRFRHRSKLELMRNTNDTSVGFHSISAQMSVLLLIPTTRTLRISMRSP
jgi:hypothetical protein